VSVILSERDSLRRLRAGARYVRTDSTRVGFFVTVASALRRAKLAFATGLTIYPYIALPSGRDGKRLGTAWSGLSRPLVDAIRLGKLTSHPSAVM